MVEHAPVEALYERPQHPYTQGLLSTLPSLDRRSDEKLLTIGGQPPNLIEAPAACPFAPRCSHVHERCRQENPSLRSVGDGHEVACFWDAGSEVDSHAA